MQNGKLLGRGVGRAAAERSVQERLVWARQTHGDRVVEALDVASPEFWHLASVLVAAERKARAGEGLTRGNGEGEEAVELLGLAKVRLADLVNAIKRICREHEGRERNFGQVCEETLDRCGAGLVN
jgi:hypothetical protein